MKLTKIGEKGYIQDNSYQKNLETGENTNLGGTVYSEPVEVEIASLPYQEGGKEFINVLHNGQLHKCLNEIDSKPAKHDDYID